MEEGKIGRSLPWPAFAGLAFVLVACLYAQVRGHQFLHWDDLGFYVRNSRLWGFSRENLWWIATSSGDGIWKPLTWLTFMLEFRWLGPEPGPHLLINPVLHACNAALAGMIVVGVLELPAARLQGLTGRAAIGAGLLTTALVAVHPVQVEAAAWLSGRKEVLCAFFYLLAVGCWVCRLHVPAQARRWSILAWCAQVLALLSKPMAVTVPAVFLMLDMVARRDLPMWRLVLEKWPYALLSLMIVPVAIWGQMAVDALPDTQSVSWAIRIAQGFDTYVSYLARCLLPVNLAPYYPAMVSVEVAHLLAGMVTVLLLSVLAVYDYWRGRRLWFLVIGWYLVVFFPVSGWLQVGEHRVADRYAYLPVLSLYAAAATLAVVWLGRAWWGRWLIVGALSGLAVLAYAQVGLWKDDRTLWEYTVLRQPASAVIYNNLGSARYDGADYPGAVQAYEAVVALEPIAGYYRNLLLACQKAGDWQRFSKYADAAVRLFPDDDFLRIQPGLALLATGHYEDAVAFYEALPDTLSGKPEVLWPHAVALANLGHDEEALAVLARLLVLKPGDKQALELQAFIHNRQQGLVKGQGSSLD